MLNLSSVQDFDAKIDKDDNLKSLDPLRFRANIIGKSVWTLQLRALAEQSFQRSWDILPPPGNHKAHGE